jgi:aspartate racemase
MKAIGLVGGMSWESTAEYYRLINKAVEARRGGLHSARCILHSVDFAEIQRFQQQGQWPEATRALVVAAQSVERAGADFVLICTNTMHKVAEAVEAALRIPLLHIADATAEAVLQKGFRRIGLLGTRFTMEEDFYRGRLEQRFGLEVIVPTFEEDRNGVHQVIFDELCRGIIREESRERVARIMEAMAEQGAEAIILGCTELGLLVDGSDSPVPLFDTTRIHALAAVEQALQPEVPSLGVNDAATSPLVQPIGGSEGSLRGIEPLDERFDVNHRGLVQRINPFDFDVVSADGSHPAKAQSAEVGLHG